MFQTIVESKSNDLLQGNDHVRNMCLSYHKEFRIVGHNNHPCIMNSPSFPIHENKCILLTWSIVRDLSKIAEGCMMYHRIHCKIPRCMLNTVLHSTSKGKHNERMMYICRALNNPALRSIPPGKTYCKLLSSTECMFLLTSHQSTRSRLSLCSVRVLSMSCFLGKF